MDHRNRGRGEPARDERQDSAGWDDPVAEQPTEFSWRPESSYRTASRRRARHRGAPEPTDPHTPSWARPAGESAAEPAAPSPSGDYWRAPRFWHTDPWQARHDTAGSGGGRHHRAESMLEDSADPAPETAYEWSGGTRRRRVRTADGWRDSDGPADDSHLDRRHPDDRYPDDRHLDDPPRSRRRRAADSAADSDPAPAPTADVAPGGATGTAERPAPGRRTTAPAARWIRSPDEIDPADRSRRIASAVEATTGGRRRRDPDAEPVRRHRDAARDGWRGDPGPVRRAAADRGGRRYAEFAPDAGEADDWSAESRPRSRPGAHRDWSADTVPWDRFTDTHTGFLARVPDDVPGDGHPAWDQASDVRDRDVRARTGRRSDGTGRLDGGSRSDQLGDDRRTARTDDDGRDVDRWGRYDEPDRWGGLTDTGQWDRFDTTEWRRDELFGSGRDDADVPDRFGEGGGTFWSGTRLAEDDPRWVGIPDSAPKSPPVTYPPTGGVRTSRRVRDAVVRSSGTSVRLPRQRGAADRRDERSGTTSDWAARRAGGRPDPARRFTSAAARRRAAPLGRRLEDDLLDARSGGSPLTAALYAAAWYAVPVLALLVWVLTLDAGVPVSCVPELSGACESERGRAMAALLDGLPRFGAALATSLLLAALFRWFNRTWRMVSIGLAAAVVGGGLSTVLFSVISGEPLG